MVLAFAQEELYHFRAKIPLRQVDYEIGQL